MRSIHYVSGQQTKLSSKKKGYSFTFHSGKNLDADRYGNLSTHDLLLADVKIDDRVKITEIKGDRHFTKYLKSLGLTIGVEFRIASRTNSGSVIVCDGNKQIGLSADITHRVAIAPLSNPV
jgi:Fe2+ transport system protein FeoA